MEYPEFQTGIFGRMESAPRHFMAIWGLVLVFTLTELPIGVVQTIPAWTNQNCLCVYLNNI